MKATHLLTVLACLTVSAFSQPADTIYHNGPILTIDDANPRSEAVAVKAGKIIALGKKMTCSRQFTYSMMNPRPSLATAISKCSNGPPAAPVRASP